MKINSVVVIEMNGSIPSVHCFSSDPDGMKEAEETFARLAKECGASKKDIAISLRSGRYEDGNDYSLFRQIC